MIFKDRKQVGEKLAEKLQYLKNTEAVIYALSRGGVVVGHEIAQSLNLPLDFFISRKIYHEFNPEYAICVVTENGHSVCNENETMKADPKWFERKVKEEQKEAQRRRAVYFKNRPMLSPKNKTAILVDDGITTGLTMTLAIKEIKNENPSKIIVVVPVAPSDAIDKIKNEVDEVITLKIDENYVGAVGEYYEDFSSVDDYDVIKIISDYSEGKS